MTANIAICLFGSGLSRCPFSWLGGLEAPAVEEFEEAEGGLPLDRGGGVSKV
jgi:hypothetical protein